jgi:hypothetical protein
MSAGMNRSAETSVGSDGDRAWVSVRGDGGESAGRGASVAGNGGESAGRNASARASRSAGSAGVEVCKMAGVGVPLKKFPISSPAYVP